MYERRNPYQAYREARNHQSPTEQIVTLYDGVLTLVRQGMEAIERKDYEARWNAIERATAIVNGLASALDYEKGGDSAQALSGFYADVENRLRHIQCHNAADVCESVLNDVKTIRDAWSYIHETQANAENVALAAARGGELRFNPDTGAAEAVPTESGDNLAEALAGLQIKA